MQHPIERHPLERLLHRQIKPGIDLCRPVALIAVPLVEIAESARDLLVGFKYLAGRVALGIDEDRALGG